MHALQATQIIKLWERLQNASPTERAVLMLAEALAADAEEVAKLPIGRRDAGLLALRRATYGALAPCFMRCPGCGTELEFEVELDAISLAGPELGAEPHQLEHDGFRLSFRLPVSADLFLVKPDLSDRVGALLARSERNRPGGR